ncbi:EAL domain-containing protein [Pseudoroseicyclus tamaricis]|uniref:EAL domain-containing protein n=1 Tax=Pseudoroseicyclus tamaricis TaxID=2705421 RepID=A0A6B2JWI0_9RHOB|nr:EAL domain-containing protein [Pseudoroseicyclus tamaricis]NDV02480.1 EAL domain-containing protein [Pseudoroseicyclus tamaricis]
MEARKPAPTSPLEAAMQSRDRDMPDMVRAALVAGRAQLAFQPVVAAGNTGKVVFHEAFIRLMDEGGRILPAAKFLPHVEETVIGRDIDVLSLKLGLMKLAQHPRLRLAINMSARSIADGAWRNELSRGIARMEGIGDRLILEISEGSAMMLPEVVTRFMAEMQPQGVHFALDDFGAGSISFSHLKDFLFDMAKVDRQFVSGIEAAPDNQVIAEALITVAHQFEMFVIAEGVETASEAEHMTRLGADCLQGWHFGVPKPTL